MDWKLIVWNGFVLSAVVTMLFAALNVMLVARSHSNKQIEQSGSVFIEKIGPYKYAKGETAVEFYWREQPKIECNDDLSESQKQEALRALLFYAGIVLSRNQADGIEPQSPGWVASREENGCVVTTPAPIDAN
jgi:hypothetical protein